MSDVPATDRPMPPFDGIVSDDPVFADASLVEALAVGDDVIVVGNTQERIAGTQSYTWQPMIWYGSARP